MAHETENNKGAEKESTEPFNSVSNEIDDNDKESEGNSIIDSDKMVND
jgi:hypothetical protein